MLSRNNLKELLRRQEPKKQRFTIKKLTVGVASVLIGFTFMGIGASANADQTSTTTDTQVTATQPNANSATGDAQSSAAQSNASSATSDAQVTPASSSASVSSAQPASSAAVNTGKSQNDSSTTQELQLNSAASVTPNEFKVNALEDQHEDVNTWEGFTSALSNKNTTAINLTQDITVNGATNSTTKGNTIGWNGALTLKGENIARKVTINGNGHTLDFGRYSLMFENVNQNDGSAWDITFEDLTIKAGQTHNSGIINYMNGVLSPISFKDVNKKNQSKDVVTFDGVTADVSTRPVISGASYQDKALLNAKLDETYTLNFKGNNVITNAGYQGSNVSPDDGNAVEAGYINFLDGTTTTINMTQTGKSGDNYGGNAVRAVQDGTSVNIADGANVTINGGKNVRGIYAGADKLTGAIDGLVNVDGNLTEIMGAGHSTAINAGNLTVGQTGKIDITTAQDNNQGLVGNLTFNGNHYGVIALGVGHLQGTYSSTKNTLTDNGSIKINRTATSKLSAPLIAFGGGGVTGNYELTVNNGATLDLQDAADQESSDHAGMVVMFGTSSTDKINFNNPAYVNLQRTAGKGSSLDNVTGNFITTQGTTNEVNITGTTPVAQWDEGNMSTTPSFVWSINDQKTMSNWGTGGSHTFTPSGKTSPQAGEGQTKLMHSNGTVIMGANQAGKDSFKFDDGTTVLGTPNYTNKGEYYAPYLNSYLNNFSWWTPQRLTIGSASYINQADGYQPEVQTINGNTSQTLSDLQAKDGIKDLITQDDTTIPLPSDATVTWYNPSTDAGTWTTVMGSQPVPTNPTGNLKTTDTSAWAKVTYGDGSVDFVNIPLHITEPSIADQQTPDGGTITVPEGHTLTPDDAKNAITNNAQLDHVSGYTWKTAPDTTVPGTKDGVVTVTYTDGSTDDVPVVVNVQSQADQYTPKGQDITTPQGTVPAAESGISNTGDLPSGTTYTWSKAPDVSKPGTVPGVVEVNYPDGSKDEVPIHVTVGTPSETNPTNADHYDPQGQNVKTTIGNVPNASEGIANKDTLPAGTTYTWSQKPNVYTKGDHPAVVQVTYPDGSVDYVPTTVTVTNEPTGKNVTTPKGVVPDAPTTIDWGNGTEPSGTTITWVTEPDVSQPGNTTGTVQITYPDHETTTVVVPVHVTDPSTENNFDPYGTTIRVPYGHELNDTDAQNAIAGGIPSGTTDVTYTWKYKPATSGANVANTTQQGYVTVKGTLNGQPVSKDVIVYVRVGDQADNYDPQGQNLTVKKGDPAPAASTAITNKNTLPAGTQYEWALGPNTNNVGTQSCLVKVTYPDHSFDYVPVNVTVTDYSTEYPVSYGGLDIERPNDNSTASKDEMPTTTTGMPAGTITGYQKGTFTDPTGTTVTVGNDGKVTVSVKKDAKRGTFNVPVKVSYQDGSTATVYVPVSITGDEVDPGGDHTYYGNQSQTIMKAVPTDVHKTSDDFTPNAANSGFNEIIHNYDWDGTSGNGNYRKHTTYKLGNDGNFHKVNADGTLSNDPNDMFAANKISYTWMNGYTPNTNFGDQTQTVLAKNPDGSFNPAEQTGAGDNLPGNSKYRVNVSIADTSVTAMLGLGFRPYSSWNNVYFNFYGAKSGNALTFKQNSDISNLTQDQYRQLIDVTDLGANGWNGTNINPNAPQVLAYEPGTDATKTFAMTWAPNGMPSTATVANGVSGTVRILFNDGTYLDVPATINVVKDNDAGKPDTDKTSFNQKISYQYNGQEVSSYVISDIAKGSSLTADQLADYINHNLPANYSIADGYEFPGAETNITSTPATIIVPLKQSSQQTDDSKYNATVDIKYVDDQGHAIQTKGGQDQIEFKFNKNDGLKANILKNAIDSNIPAGWKLNPTFTYPGDQTDNATITVPLVKNTVTPGDPGVTPGKDQYKDLFTTSTRTINVYKTDGTLDHTETQTVTFGRTGVLNQYTGKIIAGSEGDWYVYNTTTNKLTNDENGKWSKYDVPTHTGYDLLIDGHVSTTASVPAVDSVAPDTNKTVNVKYQPTEQNFSQNIVYKDKQGNVVKTINGAITGTFTVEQPGTVTAAQQKSKIDSNVPTNWKIASGYTYPGAETITSTTPDDIVVTVEHATKDINPTDPGVNPADPKYTDMFKTVTRKIYQTKPGESRQLIDTQSVLFGRKGVEDLVTGEVTGTGDWEVGQNENNQFVAGGEASFGEYDAPQIDGYDSYVGTTKTKQVSAASAVDNNGEPVNGADVEITYQPTEQNFSQNIVYKDKQGNVVKTINGAITGTFTVEQPGTVTAAQQKSKIDSNVPTNWKIASGYTYPGAETITSTTPDDIVVTVEHATKDINPTDPGVNPTDPKYTDMFKTVNRKIYQTKPGESRQLIDTQSVLFGRKGVEDLVTGEVTGTGAWEVGQNENNQFVAGGEASFGEYDAPQIDGYDSYVGTTKTKQVSAASAVDNNGEPANGADIDITYQPTAPATTDADKYAPSYQDTTVNAKAPVDTGAPSFTSDGQPATAPAGTKFAFSNGQTSMTITDKNGQNPVTATIDANTGAITFTAPDAATEYDVPVTVTYPDASNDLATAKVFVNKTVDPTTVNPTDPTYKDMFKTVTRDIITTATDGHVTTDTQSLDFGRTMTIHGDGSANTYGNWEAGKINGTRFTTTGGSNEFATKGITQVTDYTSYYQIGNGSVVAGTEVPSASALDENGNPVNGTTVHVTYKSNSTTPVEDTKVTYQFHDDTDNKNVGAPVVVTGKPGTQQSTGLTVPAGYKLAAGQTLPTTVTMPAETGDTIVIHLVHATKTVKPGDPGVDPSNPLYQGMFKTVTRTINVQNPDGTTDQTIQQVHFNRSETIDEVTNKVLSYGDWTLADGSASDWNEFNVPQLDGYTSYVDGNAANNVAAENVTPTTADVTVNVTYKANSTTPVEDTKVTYQFHDDTDNKNVGAPVVVTGKPGTQQSTGLTIPEGYKLAAGQTLPTTVTMPAETGDTIVIHLVHATKTVKPGDPGVDPSNPLYQGMFKTVTRTINVQNPDGTTNQTIQQVHFNRSETIDEVTNKVLSYGDWTLADGSASDWNEYNVPQLDGYTSYVDGNAAENVAEENVTPTTADVTVNVTYQKNTPAPEQGEVVITYVDQEDPSHILGTTSVSGTKGDSVDVANTIKDNVPANWKIASDYTIPSTAEVPGSLTVPLVHATKTVNPGEPGVDPSNPLYQGMFKTVTRTINVQNPDGTTKQTLQQVHFNRSETIDEVTNEVLSYGDWTLADGSASDWNEFDVPQLDGYTSYVDGNAAENVAAENVTPETADVVVNVTYQKNNNGNPSTPTNPDQPGDNNKPTNPNDHGNGNGNGNGNNTTPAGPNHTGNEGNGVINNGEPITGNQAGNNNQATTKSLPQTGDTKDSAAIAGLGLLALASLLGFGKRQKRD